MEFDSGILSTEPPIDSGLSGVAFPLQDLDFPAKGSFVWNPSPEAGASQDAELDLRHVEPTTVLGRMVELQPFYDAPGFGSGKCLVQGSRTMSVQVVQDNTHHRGFGVGLVHQPSHLSAGLLRSRT